jgi:hypothetical protein
LSLRGEAGERYWLGMGTTSAERMRVRRERAREGKCVVLIEIDEDDIEALCRARQLDPMADHRREDIADAVKRVLRTMPCEA